MSEQNPEQPAEQPALVEEQRPELQTPPSGETGESGKSASSGRFAAYDLDRLRFVGGVHDTKTDARKAGKLAASRIEVREV